MKSISEKIIEVTEKEFEKLNKDSKNIEINNFLNEMKSKGLIQPKSYTLPPLDTIGKRQFQN